jgi:hypothetical protein
MKKTISFTITVDVDVSPVKVVAAKAETSNEILTRPVSDLVLKTGRAKGVVRNAARWVDGEWKPVETIGDLAQMTCEDFLRTPNCGKVTLADIEGALRELGIPLAEV